MIAHYTAASVVSENRSTLLPCVSADSIPTSAGQEDHVSMGATSGRKALQILTERGNRLAIEALAAAQALDYRAPLEPAPLTGTARAAIRSGPPPLEEDRALSGDMNAWQS